MVKSNETCIYSKCYFYISQGISAFLHLAHPLISSALRVRKYSTICHHWSGNHLDSQQIRVPWQYHMGQCYGLLIIFLVLNIDFKKQDELCP